MASRFHDLGVLPREPLNAAAPVMNTVSRTSPAPAKQAIAKYILLDTTISVPPSKSKT
jgi:hypothetical protein